MAPLIETRNVILFDLDGTILDNMDLMYESMNKTMPAFGYPVLTREKFTTLMGMEERKAFDSLGVLAEHVEEMICFRREAYRKLAYKVVFFEEINELMTTLEEAGCTLGIVTGSDRETVNTTRAAVAAASKVNVLVTADDTLKHKPDPAPILLALQRLGRESSEAVYIGDGVNDIESARRAGCIAVLADWNHLDVYQHFTCQPDYTVKSVAEFLRILFGELEHTPKAFLQKMKI